MRQVQTSIQEGCIMGYPVTRPWFDRSPRRNFSLLTSIAACAVMLLCGSAYSQDVASFYNGKNVRIIVGFSAGGGYDLYARLLARHIGRHIPGNPAIIVQNMPGSASLKSVQYLDVGAPADGTVITTFNPGLITQSITTPDKAPVKFLNYAWVGNISEDFRVCYTWHASGVKNWQDFLAKENLRFGNTGAGTSAYIDNRMLSVLLGAKIHQVQGYPGSADKRLAIERGELDGDCGSWTSLPDDWVKDNKITLLVRFSRTRLPDMPATMAYASDLLSDQKKKEIFSLLTAGALIGRPFIAPRNVPADRVAALRAAFDATMKDPEFLADAEKQRMTVLPMTGGEVETAIKKIYQTPPDIVAAAKDITGE
jgi:tripartite-type tricarboxylate transporter receptor subunit TctC